MKSIATIIVLFSSFFGASDEYLKTKTELVQAVENRNFVEVKVLLNEIMPLMKDDLKQVKSKLTEAKKNSTKEEYDSSKSSFDRKSEIYKTMHHLMDVSPAAVRARSEQIVRLLNEFERV